MKKILLSNGDFALVSDEDFDKVSQFKWHVANGYARAHRYDEKGNKVSFLMHRYILGLGKGNRMVGDHINHNKLDNTRSNIRICTPSQNSQNKNIGSTNTSGYKGVSFNAATKKWYAQITVNWTTTRLGSFDTPKKAHVAYCKAARAAHGKFANFGKNSKLVEPGLPPRIVIEKKPVVAKKPSPTIGRINKFWIQEKKEPVHVPFWLKDSKK